MDNPSQKTPKKEEKAEAEKTPEKAPSTPPEKKHEPLISGSTPQKRPRHMNGSIAFDVAHYG